MHQVEVPEILYDENAKLKLLKGVEKLTKAVQVTLGPKGKTVAISLLGSVPHLTKDGATVARSLTLVDPYENIGASLVREAAQSSAEVVGDGTTTSIVLAYNILKNSQQLVVAGQSANELAEGMKQAYNLVLAELEKKKTLVNSDSLLRDVATISANGEAGLGQLIADAINRVGYDGAISVQQAKGFDTKLDIVDGTFISRGFESPYFVTHNAKQIVELESPLVLIVNDSVVSMHSILPALEHAISCGRSLLLVCNEISGEALQTLVLNKIKGGLKVCAIKSPEFGSARIQAMQDLAALTNAKILMAGTKLTSGEIAKYLGSCNRAEISKSITVLFGTERNEEVEERLKSIRNVLEDPGATEDDKAIAQRRLNTLSNGIAVIQVGGATEAEMLERLDRVDDALCAAKAALKGGIQPGGGVALVRAARIVNTKLPRIRFESEGELMGARAFLRALDEPMRQIAENCGKSPDIVLQKIVEKPYKTGYDGRRDKYGNMFKLGILDPHLVVVSSLKNSLSVACNLLSIGCTIVRADMNKNDGLTSFSHI